jgi:hypothetical protein
VPICPPAPGRFHRRGADLPAGAGTVLDDHRLLPVLAHALRDDAPGDVRARARGERHDQADGPRGIVLRGAGASNNPEQDCEKPIQH